MIRGLIPLFLSQSRLFLTVSGVCGFAFAPTSIFAQESANWQVTTFAGQAGVDGAIDGSGTAAQFSGPRGIVADSAGNLYVADTANNAIRKITPEGQVSTYAGAAGPAGYIDGASTVARFNQPAGLAIDAVGTLYVADYLNHSIRTIATDGTVRTLAGAGPMSSGSADGSTTQATFFKPSGVALDTAGNVYVADSGNSLLREISAAGTVTTLALGIGSPQFNNPYGVTVDSNGTVYLADTSNNVIRTIAANGAVSTLAGSSNGTSGSADGTGGGAQFHGPSAIAIDASGKIYVTESGNHDVRTISGGLVTAIAGNPSASGFIDGAGNTSSFNAPQGVTVTSDGTVYVCDTLNSTIRKLVRVQVTAPPVTPSGPTDPTTRFTNISTRSYVGTGPNILIGGFIIGGTTPKKVLIRASGPALIPMGVSASSALADPVLQLYQGGTVIASNDDWSAEPVNASAVQQANQTTNTNWPAGSKDSALVETLQPGGYTAMVTGKNSGTGIALIEIFELDSDGGSKLINISTRSRVQTGAGVQIAGFIISGNSPKKVLIRAGGPFLTQLGLSSSAVLSDPVINLYQGSSVISTNDNWGSDAANVQQACAASGATPYAAGSNDAAIVTTLSPGGYTAIVTGKNGTQGIALIEVDEVP